ncbi:Leucine-rich repeat serine/threonine-protein kinase 2 [Phytophthora pseudosyringae]|uniref:Leucine-rich repeat serine/threonine-protein kinase 2 n=1 Tax=Phytophthora pseudosyringae TaxID=221518 RepID=A0A8T1VGZ9_9STRA|nr:Leucine-rich repeat serine/threonine-protein kinase 2 [Phytophthora pseudosyringae]
MNVQFLKWTDAQAELIVDVDAYTFPLAGQSARAMLRDAEQLCDEEPGVAALNRRVVNRLKDLYEQFTLARNPCPAPIFEDVCSIVWRFLIRLEQRSSDYLSATVTLCASRTIANRNFGLHHAIDHLILRSPVLHSSAAIHRWQPSWRDAQEHLRASVESEAAAVLQYEAVRFAVSGGIALPRWFILSYQVEIEEHIVDRSFGSANRGRRLGADVVAKQVLTDQAKRENREQFRHELDLWFALNHPNLIKLFGASHEGQPFFVCERATGGTLTSFLKGKDRKIIWRSLWYAAWVLATFTRMGSSTAISKAHTRGRERVYREVGRLWLECLGGQSVVQLRCRRVPMESPRGPARVSFDFCVGYLFVWLEAVAGDYPWGMPMGDDAVKYSVAEKQQLPLRPTAFLDAEWELVERMCCFDPEKRISALAVVQSAKRIQQWYSLGYMYLVEDGSDQRRRQCRLSSQFA